MKKLLFTAATGMLLFLVSCKDSDTTTTTSSDNSQNEKNLANNREVYKAMETGDVSKIKEFIDKDAIDHGGNPDGSDLKGGDSIVAMLGKVRSGFSDIKMEVIADAANGDYVFSLNRLTGTTNSTPVWGMPPNTKIDSRHVDVVKIKDGKATDHWGFMDPKEMSAMMGGDPKKDNKMDPKMDHSKMDTTKK
jgi:predicted SnoaL-like aldol condensation-catalyzing enzyme